MSIKIRKDFGRSSKYQQTRKNSKNALENRFLKPSNFKFNNYIKSQRQHIKHVGADNFLFSFFSFQ